MAGRVREGGMACMGMFLGRMARGRCIESTSGTWSMMMSGNQASTENDV